VQPKPAKPEARHGSRIWVKPATFAQDMAATLKQLGIEERRKQSNLLLS
jgi:hypothetical protein